MHRLLERQLYKLGLEEGSSPSASKWSMMLQRISETYEQADNDRYLLERSLQISSDETREMFQKQKASTEGRLQALVNALPDLVFMLDEEGRYVEIIASDKDLLHMPVEEMKGRCLTELIPRQKADFFLTAIRKALDDNTLHLIEYSLSVPLGERIFEGRIMPTGLRVNNRKTVLFLARDITELAESRESLEHMATHDGLTGMPNRILLHERVVQAIARAKRLNSRVALMVLDLDRFKQINDSLGHSVGDTILQEVAERLKKACRTEDTVARFGGDEFVLVVEDLEDSAHAGRIAQRMLEAFSESIHVADFELDVTASIGISVFPDDGKNCDVLLRQADSAMYVAKEAGRNQYSYYTEELGSNAIAYLALESKLRQAITNRELLLLYQPQFLLTDLTLVGFEALVRWPSAEANFHNPASFIPVAEMSGLIEPMGLWVLNEACRQAVAWTKAGLNFGRIAINFSSRQFNNPLLKGQVQNILDCHQLSGDILEFEITESMVVQEGGVAHRNLEAFAAMGVNLAIDDFGTGHSSMINLKRFSLNRLKIDRSFISGVGTDSNDEAITGASIALAKQLGLDVVAEGVETRKQVEFLKQHKCDIVQGFLFSQPLTAAAAEKLMACGEVYGDLSE